MTIYFKPLGINQFVENLEIFFEDILGLHFNLFEDFIHSMESIFKIKDREIQREKLEHYWLSKLKEKDFSELEKIISDIESDLRIDDIAIRNNFSRQYLNRLFSKTIGKSPSEYRKIHRFRNAIINQKKQKNLTHLSLESSFYDQSHLIKDFKQLTNVSPNSFFKTVNTEKENIWLFI
ncbi:DNA-binding transcriptional activator FeaR [compost metagenome]